MSSKDAGRSWKALYISHVHLLGAEMASKAEGPARGGSPASSARRAAGVEQGRDG